MRSSRILLMSFLLIGALEIAAEAQSNGRVDPTPLTSNTITGTGTGKKIENFYSFTAGPGEVALTIDLKAKSGSTGADVEVFDADGSKIFYYYPNATSTNERTIKKFTVERKQMVGLRLAFDRDAGQYAIKISGAVDLGPDDGQPTSPQIEAPDLVVTQIVFEQSPARIRVRVMNAGNAASTKGFLALTSLGGDDSSLSTKQRTWTIPIPALEAGKGFSNVIDVSPLTQTNGPWKATVDRSNTVKESNEENNSITYPQVINPGNL